MEIIIFNMCLFGLGFAGFELLSKFMEIDN